MSDATGLLCTLWSKYRFTIAVAFISYIALVRILRYRRMVKIEAPFALGKKDLSEMTVKEAHAILTQLQELEFPHAFSKARKIALLKVRQNCGRFNSTVGNATKPNYCFRLGVSRLCPNSSRLQAKTTSEIRGSALLIRKSSCERCSPNLGIWIVIHQPWLE